MDLIFGLVFITLTCVALHDQPFRRLAQRWARTSFDPTAYGLAPRAQLDPERAGPPMSAELRREAQAIADAAWDGDWRPAAAYVAGAGRSWDERWSRLELLTEIADSGDAWLTAWRIADPNCCDAATLEAKLLVRRAWAIRGSGFAHEVPPENMARFRELLPAAIEAARRAALLSSEDPGPWVVMVTAARGAQYTPEQFAPLWAGLAERAPHHYEGHWQGMQYWCAKWYGSDREMLAFAERAMDAAPAGSPLPGIYLHAVHELAKRNAAGKLLASAQAKRRLRAVAAALATVPPDDPHLPALRHLLASFFYTSGLYAPALEQFRLLGPWCGAAPWTAAEDPAAEFDLARGVSVKRARARPLPRETGPVKSATHRHGG
ncbi:hypothetical protein [Kitasatospora sp. NPDC056181]|uniref:hypothetical protein n=1 Tax=Kitasatospora sp. NPDC056181 TaxID=3345737 RepID=UPI0035E27EAA